MKFKPLFLVVGCAVALSSVWLDVAFTNADDFDDALNAVKAVKKDGKGHDSAVKAMALLNQSQPQKIPAMLEAMDGCSRIGVNWLRGAIQSAASRNPDSLPKEAIQAYFDNTKHHPLGRLLAFDLLTDGNDSLKSQMIDNLIDDPSLPLRFKAIAKLVTESDSVKDSDPVAAVGKLSFALSKARDVSQIQSIAGKLKEVGVNVDLQRQLGFLSTWHLVGSFDNKDMKGFDVAYGPENDVENVNLEATYNGLEGAEAKWKKVSTVDNAGNVNLNELIGKVKGATVYAYTTFRTDDEKNAQFRIGTANATKIWLNGKLVMSNEIYHNSNSIDKFIGDVTLAKGKNEILIKVCQNEQTQPWAQDWQFQFRICEKSGKAIPEFTPASPRN